MTDPRGAITSSHSLTLLLVLLMAGCSDKGTIDPSVPSLRPVKTVQIEQTSQGPFKEFTAVVDASQKVDLSFKVSGRIEELPVKSGDEVKKGQLIARLDETDFKVRLREAQSNYDKALSDFNRAKDLIKTNTISQSEFDQLKAAYNSSLAQLENAKNQLAYTSLEATFDGVIAQRYMENFQDISAAAPVVALHDLNNINFKVDVPESIIINTKPEAQPPKVKAFFASIPDRSFDLTFKEISTQADDIAKTYQVTFTMPNPSTHIILPGMSARVRVERVESDTVVAEFYLPAQSVLKDKGGNYVFTVSANGDGTGTIHRHNITIGNITSWGLEVFSGVQSGQHVVTAGMSKVSEGMLVKFQG